MTSTGKRNSSLEPLYTVVEESATEMTAVSLPNWQYGGGRAKIIRTSAIGIEALSLLRSREH